MKPIKRKKGGRTKMVVSGNPDVLREAEGGPEHKSGGAVKKKAGGKVIGKMYGGPVRARLDRPGRKQGGRVGADKAPLSSAHKGHSDGHETPSSEDTYGGNPG